VVAPVVNFIIPDNHRTAPANNNGGQNTFAK
jgi:hypothetical protein